MARGPDVPPAPTGGITGPAVLAALRGERDHVEAGLAYTVSGARQDDGMLVVGVEPAKGRRSGAVDEGLEGSRAAWGGGRADVFVVDPDRGELVLRWPQGSPPSPGDQIRLYPRDFLTPLLLLWERDDLRRRAIRHAAHEDAAPMHADAAMLGRLKGLALRQRQGDAVEAALHPTALVVGPPGTGKTYTVGAMVAYLLQRFTNARVLLTGPTNVAVDTALLAADDALDRLGRQDLRSELKRIGSRFDARKYVQRDHLLVDRVGAAAARLVLLELEEPPRSDTRRHVAWKEQVERARAELKSDVAQVASAARVVAVTTASAFIWHEALMSSRRWHFVVCDEASQVTLPAALMIRTFGHRAVYAGDPNQLAPIVQNQDAGVQRLLARTAFDGFAQARRVQLNEQSRMCYPICDVVAKTFYGDDLRVCSRSLRDEGWKRDRSPTFIDGRELPRILFDDRGGEPTWSERYGGLIRFESAKLVEAFVHELLGSYTDEKDILVLTPFRAQRALLRAMLRHSSAKSVRISTVHRSQGSESRIVVFDPVDAAGKFLSGENGRRLINVAVSRAQAHVFIPVGPKDMSNPWLGRIHRRALELSRLSDPYADSFRVHIRDRAGGT